LIIILKTTGKMKKTPFIAIIGLLISFFSQAQNTVTLQKLWESDTSLKTPESVLVDEKAKVLYVSCINGKPEEGNSKSYISKVGLDGKVITLKFTENLNSTKGMDILDGKLYVTEMTNVVEIDLSSGKVLNKYPVEGAKFLNDISVDTKGKIVYISDSGNSKIHALSKGKVTTVLEGAPLKGTNGLLVENNQVLIGNGDGSLLSFNPASKKVTTVASGMGGIDGIVALGGKKYIVTEWGGKVWYVGANGKPELKINSEKDKINTADLGYNATSKVIYIPTFFHNTVQAYSVK
jgi:hypothetical protein